MTTTNTLLSAPTTTILLSLLALQRKHKNKLLRNSQSFSSTFDAAAVVWCMRSNQVDHKLSGSRVLYIFFFFIFIVLDHILTVCCMHFSFIPFFYMQQWLLLTESYLYGEFKHNSRHSSMLATSWYTESTVFRIRPDTRLNSHNLFGSSAQLFSK